MIGEKSTAPDVAIGENSNAPDVTIGEISTAPNVETEEGSTAPDVTVDENATAPESTMVQSFTSSHTETDGNTTRNVVTEAHSETTDGKSSQSFVQHETVSTIGGAPVSSLTYHETGAPFMPSFTETAALNESPSKPENTIVDSKKNTGPTYQTKDMSVPVFNVKNVNKDFSSHGLQETVAVSKENIAPPSFNVRNVRHQSSITQVQSMFDPMEIKEQRPEKPPPTIFRVKNVKDGALYKNQPPPVMEKPKRKPAKMPLGENVPQFNIKSVGERPRETWQPAVTVTATTKSNYPPDFHPTGVEGMEHSYNSMPDLYGPPAHPHHLDGEHPSHRPGHLHIFGPPVEFHTGEEDFPSMGSEPGTPDTTSTGWSKRSEYL